MTTAPTPRYAEAVAWAVELHGPQVRKGTTIPYLTHLLAVSSLVWEHGGDEDDAIAGIPTTPSTTPTPRPRTSKRASVRR